MPKVILSYFTTRTIYEFKLQQKKLVRVENSRNLKRWS